MCAILSSAAVHWTRLDEVKGIGHDTTGPHGSLLCSSTLSYYRAFWERLLSPTCQAAGGGPSSSSTGLSADCCLSVSVSVGLCRASSTIGRHTEPLALRQVPQSQ